MYPHVIADLLECAWVNNTTIGSQAAYASQGSTAVRNALLAQMHRGLRLHGSMSPNKPTTQDLRNTASALRKNNPFGRRTCPRRLAEIFTGAAAWMQERPYSTDGPYSLVVTAVEASSVRKLAECFDALTAISNSVQALTISEWERRYNRDGRSGVVRMLRNLAQAYGEN